MQDEPKTPENRSEVNLLSKLLRLEFREFWWGVLDRWEARRSFRRWIVSSVLVGLLALCCWLWFYPLWARRNAVRMARQWMEADKPAYAADVIRQSLESDPKQPELWSLASELAGRSGQKFMQVQYAHQAYAVQPEEKARALEWASAALQADMMDEAKAALAEVPEPWQQNSGYAQRLQGEIARRQNQLEEAKRRFLAAAALEGGGAVNELPLGICLLAMPDPAERQNGISILSRLAADPAWGAAAARALLAEAARTNNLPEMARWAETLRTNPGCTVADIPNCLGALAAADPAKYAEVMAGLKRDHLATPQTAAQLVGWLNQIGRSGEALEWLSTLPEANVKRPPLAVSKAEALRCLADWNGLRAWTNGADWGRDLNFLCWAYGLCAARSLRSENADDLWKNLRQHAERNSVHGEFAGTTLFAWGLTAEAEALWWTVAGSNSNLAVEALGTLARFYQTRREAAGQYRVFNQLHALHPKDDATSNNFAFFAALTKNREQLAESLAKDNRSRHSADPTYQATYAFVLYMRGDAAGALKAIEPWKQEAGRSAAVSLAYGLALAGNGRKEEARSVLERLNPATLTLREIEVIRAALAD